MSTPTFEEAVAITAEAAGWTVVATQAGSVLGYYAVVAKDEGRRQVTIQAPGPVETVAMLERAITR